LAKYGGQLLGMTVALPVMTRFGDDRVALDKVVASARGAA
jgi:hypothetical protein